MADHQTTLTAEQVRHAGLDGWRQIGRRIRARFRTGDFGTGLRLVDAIGEAAQATDHHPDLTLTVADVIVSLSSHDVGGITERDLDLARRISACSAELGVVADVSGLTQVDYALDTSRGEDLAPFYAALLGTRVVRGEAVDPTGQVPIVRWQDTPAQDAGGPAESSPAPPQQTPQRGRLEVWVTDDDAPRRLQAVLRAGGRLVSDASAPAHWVVEDPDGNRSWICTATGTPRQHH